MKKNQFKKLLAENGYNVGFGAKKHFSTYDIVVKIPNLISIATLIVGIVQIYSPNFKYNKEVSILLIIMAVIALYIDQYKIKIDEYDIAGRKLTEYYNKLKELYYKVDSMNDDDDFSYENEMMNNTLSDFYKVSLTKQIMFSNWYAHYKFFFEMQHEWIDYEKHFTWKDKFPLSLIILFITSIIIIIAN